MRRNAALVVVALAASSVAVAACTGGDSKEPEPGGVPPNPTVNDTTSYAYARTGIHFGRQSIRSNGIGFVNAFAHGDFDGDGDEDVVLAPGDGSASPAPLEAYRNDGGTLVRDDALFAAAGAGAIHGRKGLRGDYDGDGRPDVFIADHGYDQPPFPGAAPLLLLSGSDGKLTSSSLPSFSGFNHAAASADIDADGDLDVVLTGGPWFLLNDGIGSFTRDTTLLPPSLIGAPVFTAELVDVDEDGWVDLLLSGHEQDGFSTQIRWGSRSGRYLTDVTILPAVSGYGVVIDLDAEDIDGDGDRDLVFTRTGSTDFYVGYSLQVLVHDGARAFTDETATRVAGVPDAATNWFDFIRLADTNADGSVDILVEDRDRNMRWLNDGSGNFALTTVF